MTVARARKLQRFMSQPFAVAEVFTGMEGRLVAIEDTIAGFKAICEGGMDQYPEQAFYMVGDTAEVESKAAKIAEEAAARAADE